MLIMRLHQAVKEIQLKTQFYLKNDELTLFRINALHWVKKKRFHISETEEDKN